MNPTRILVTGGNGLLGGYVLRDLIAARHEVTCFARHPSHIRGVRSIIGDIREPAGLRQAIRGHEAVIHLAAVTGPGRSSLEDLMCTNLMGTMHVLEGAVDAKLNKMVFASSCAASGFAFQRHEIIPRYLPIDEHHPSEPEDEYGLSKLLCEIACKRYSAAFGIHTICLRIANAWYVDREGASVATRSGWAKGLSVEAMWSRRYRKYLLEPEGEWPMPGAPPPRNVLWAVTDARDVAQAFRLAVESQNLLHEVFNVNGFDTCSLVPTETLLARHFPHVPVRAILEGNSSLISCERAVRLLGYRPNCSWRRSDFSNWLERDLKTKSKDR